jgi:undecaprenyl-diphosphatase
VEALSGLDWPVVTPILRFISDVHTLVFLLVGVVLMIRQRRLAPFLMTVVAALVAGRVGAVLKDIIDRPRPWVSDPSVHPLIAHPQGSSMPSGHALTSFACAVVLASFAPRLRWPLLVFAGLVAFSRPYLGVHYPSDVIVGSLIGVGLGMLLNAAYRLGCRHRASRRTAHVGSIASETPETH